MTEKVKIQRVTTKALFLREGKILFLQDTEGRWELPGGTMKFREAPEEALGRELVEELGWPEVNIGPIFHSGVRMKEKENASYQFIVLIFRCEPPDATIHLSPEHISYQWLLPNEVRELDTPEVYKEAVRIFSRQD